MVTSPLEESFSRRTFVPLSLIRRGGVIIEEGLTPLLNTLTLLNQSKESQREAKPLLHNSSPPLIREGDKGGG